METALPYSTPPPPPPPPPPRVPPPRPPGGVPPGPLSRAPSRKPGTRWGGGRNGGARSPGAPPSPSPPAAPPPPGLLPETRYALVVVAYSGSSVIAGDTLRFVTGALPTDLAPYVASGSDPSPGYVAFAAGPYGLVIDNTGRVVWYHRFPNGPGLNFQAGPTRRYFARPTIPDPTDRDPWVGIDPPGNVPRTSGCARALQP